MNLFEFLLVTSSNIISLNVRDGKIKLCFTDIGAEDLSLEALLDEVDEAIEEAKQLGRNQSVIAFVIQRGDLKFELRWVLDAFAAFHQNTG